MKKFFQRLQSNPASVPTSVGTVIELFKTKIIVELNGIRIAFPKPEKILVKIHDLVLVDEKHDEIIEIISQKDLPPIGILYDGVTKPYPYQMNDIAGIETIKNRLIKEICLPISNPEYRKIASKLKLQLPTGILFEGPPGCGKTMLASALAAYMKLPLLVITPSDIVNSLVGESARNISRVFRYCRNNAPIVLFIDEIESLSPKRGQSRESAEIDRMFTQLLIEMNRLPNQNRSSTIDEQKINEIDLENSHEKNNLEYNEIINNYIFVIGATNRKDLVDSALLRPGRLSMQVFIPQPDQSSRSLIIEQMLIDVPKEVNIHEISLETDGFSGADLKHLIQLAKINAIEQKSEKVTQEHILSAIRNFNITNKNKLEFTISEYNHSYGDIKNSQYSLFLKYFGKYFNQ